MGGKAFAAQPVLRTGRGCSIPLCPVGSISTQHSWPGAHPAWAHPAAWNGTGSSKRLNSFQNLAPGSCGSLPEQRQGTLTSAPALTASLYSCNTLKGPLRASSFAWQIQNLANFSAWGTRDSTVEISSAWTPCKEKGKGLKKGVMAWMSVCTRRKQTVPDHSSQHSPGGGLQKSGFANLLHNCGR